MAKQPTKMEIKDPIGVDIATLSYKIEEKTYKLNPEGHLPAISDKIEKLTDEYEAVLKDNTKTEKERRDENRRINKGILEISLQDFKYDEAAAIHGHGLLDATATELYRFFVNGGMAGLKHSLRVLGLTTLNTSNGSEEAASKVADQ